MVGEALNGSSWRDLDFSQALRLASYHLVETESNEDLLVEMHLTIARVSLQTSKMKTFDARHSFVLSRCLGIPPVGSVQWPSPGCFMKAKAPRISDKHICRSWSCSTPKVVLSKTCRNTGRFGKLTTRNGELGWSSLALERLHWNVVSILAKLSKATKGWSFWH